MRFPPPKPPAPRTRTPFKAWRVCLAVLALLCIASPAAAQTPTITSISPASPLANGTAQTVTIHGTGFTNTSTVTVRHIGSGQLYPNRPVTSRTSTTLTFNFNFGTTPTAWSVVVVDGEQRSVQLNFTTLTAPRISSISPAVPLAANDPVPLTINGSNFSQTSTVTLRNEDSGQTYTDVPITSRTGNTLTLNFNFGGRAAAWTVQVVDEARTSGVFSFSTLAFAVTSVSPASPLANGTVTGFTVYGTGFTGTTTVTLRNLTTGETFERVPITERTNEALRVNVNFGAAVAQWSVQVIDGPRSSEPFAFTTTDPATQNRLTWPAPALPKPLTEPQWAAGRSDVSRGIAYAVNAPLDDPGWSSPDGGNLFIMQTHMRESGRLTTLYFTPPVRHTPFPDSGSFWMRYDPRVFGHWSEKPCFFQAFIWNLNGPGGVAPPETAQFLIRTLESRDDSPGWYEVKFPYPTSPFWQMPFELVLVFDLFVESAIDPNLDCALALELSSILGTYGLVTVSAEDRVQPSYGNVLGAPYPNPSRGMVTLPVEAEASVQARVSVYDLLGREVEVVHEGPLFGGTDLRFDASDLAPGVYLVRAYVGGEVLTRRIVVR